MLRNVSGLKFRAVILISLIGIVVVGAVLAWVMQPKTTTQLADCPLCKQSGLSNMAGQPVNPDTTDLTGDPVTSPGAPEGFSLPSEILIALAAVLLVVLVGAVGFLIARSARTRRVGA